MSVETPRRRETDSPMSYVTPSRGLWPRFKNHLRNTKAPMGVVYAGGLIVLGGWLGVQYQQDQIWDAQRASDRADIESKLQDQEIQTWFAASVDYVLCRDNVTRSDLNRQQWQDIADGVEEQGATAFAERIRNGPVLSAPARLIEDCIEPGPAPPGAEVLEALVPTTSVPRPADSSVTG